jgi:hypothetical protein
MACTVAMLAVTSVGLKKQWLLGPSSRVAELVSVRVDRPSSNEMTHRALLPCFRMRVYARLVHTQPAASQRRRTARVALTSASLLSATLGGAAYLLTHPPEDRNALSVPNDPLDVLDARYLSETSPH